jgi:hypothetical protein
VCDLEGHAVSGPSEVQNLDGYPVESLEEAVVALVGDTPELRELLKQLVHAAWNRGWDEGVREERREDDDEELEE